MYLSVPRLLLSVVSFLSCASSIDVSVARWCCSDSACNFFPLLCQYWCVCCSLVLLLVPTVWFRSCAPLSLSLSWFVFFVASRGYTSQRFLHSCSLEEMANVALYRQCASTCLCLNSAIPKKRHVRPQRTSCLSLSLQLETRLKERRLSHSDGLMKLTASRIIQVTEVMHPKVTSHWQFCFRFRPVYCFLRSDWIASAGCAEDLNPEKLGISLRAQKMQGFQFHEHLASL